MKYRVAGAYKETGKDVITYYIAENVEQATASANSDGIAVLNVDVICTSPEHIGLIVLCVILFIVGGLMFLGGFGSATQATDLSVMISVTVALIGSLLMLAVIIVSVLIRIHRRLWYIEKHLENKH